VEIQGAALCALFAGLTLAETVLVRVAFCIAVLAVAGGVFIFFLVPHIVLVKTMYRDPKKPRYRGYSEGALPQSEENATDHQKMFMRGIAWAEKHKDKICDLKIVSDRLNLYGQYVDFGYKKCAVIIQGRTESLLYSYYFADVYAQNGYNILVIDTRAHGLSDGKYVTAGVLEHRDLVKWIELIETQYGVKSFALHGICIGAAGAIYAYGALKKAGKGAIIEKLVLDGLYTSYYQVFKNHHIERKKPVIFVPFVLFYLFLRTGARLFKWAPIKYIKNVDCPALFIWSEQDFYVKPSKGRELFAACPSQYKELRFFPRGRHSHVRINQTEEYDSTITDFLQK